MKSVNDLFNFLSYNKYLSDPFSENNPDSSICARSDLKNSSYMAFGCTDVKATDNNLV